MESNNTPQVSDQESDLPLPDNLVEWITNEFPGKEIVYRKRAFMFHSDIPIDAMEEVAAFGESGVDRVKFILKTLSIAPKITDEVLAVMPASMMMDLYNQLFPKKASESSPAENTSIIS